ncbi:MAG: CsgG/HfaB family protein [Pseudomonadota bacterium]
MQTDRDKDRPMLLNTKTRTAKLIVLTALGILSMLLLADGAEAKSKKKQQSAEALEAALTEVQCAGLKPRVAVYGFYATGKMASFEGFNVGDGLAAQLATALNSTDCFVVLDRTGLSDILREQELGLAGVVNRDTAPKAGRLVGAEVIIKGTITEFDPNKRGGGLTLGMALPKTPLGLRLGRNGSKAHVGLDVSVIDASTGQVKFSHRVTADSKTGGWTIGLDFKEASIGGDTFAKTPLGIASRNALGQAVLLIADDLKTTARRFQIASLDAGEVYLNADQASGVKAGDQYKVSTVVRTLIDPATGLLLDTVEREVGKVKILEVTERYARAELLEGTRIKRGDFVHL